MRTLLALLLLASAVSAGEPTKADPSTQPKDEVIRVTPTPSAPQPIGPFCAPGVMKISDEYVVIAIHKSYLPYLRIVIQTPYCGGCGVGQHRPIYPHVPYGMPVPSPYRPAEGP